MGIVLPLEAGGRVETILEALERRGWRRPPGTPWHYREKLEESWVWFGKLRGEEAYVLSSDVLGDMEPEAFLAAYRRGVRGLQGEAEALRTELELPGLAKVELEFS
jgi:hypothetical protein